MATTKSRQIRRAKTSSAESPETSTPPAPQAEPQVQMVPLADIDRDGDNHRLESTRTKEGLQELAQSLNGNGQQQPVQVFEYPAGQISPQGRRYLLAFGFRRCAAAELNGWQAISAVIKPLPTLPDGSPDVLAIQRVRSIENLQRENLNPIEECVLVEQLAKNLPPTIEGTPTHSEDGRLTDAATQFLAKSIGRTEAWVRDRLYLSRLSPAVKEKVISGKLFLIYAREIAKLADNAEQERLAVMCEADTKDGHCHTTIHQVRRYVAERQNSLRGVPWHLDKAFPKHRLIVGPCSTCPFNSSNDKRLFEHDLQPVPEGFCLRPSCFDAKREVTDKAVTVAVTKIVNQKKSPTEGTAAEVAAEYVKPGRVARQAKRQIEGTPAAKPAKKTEYWETPEYKARTAFSDATQKWRDEVCTALTASLKANPGRLIALLLLDQARLIRGQMTEKELMKAQSHLKATIKPTWQDVLGFERRALANKQFDVGCVINLHNAEPLIKALAELYKVDLPEIPKLEDFLPDSKLDPEVVNNGH